MMKTTLLRIALFLMALLPFVTRVEAQTYNGTGGSVPDAGPVIYFPLVVSGLAPATLSGQHGLTTICLSISHTYDADLVARLQAPDGTILSLFTNVGGGNDNFTATCFDTTGLQPIGSGSAPFTGTFVPEGNIGMINNGQNGNGTWYLLVQDVAGQDTGSVLQWSLTFGPNAPHPVQTASDIPLVVLNTNGQNIPGSGSDIVAQMRIIDHGPGNLNHDNDSGNVFSGHVHMHVHGSFSASLPQKPYAISTLNSGALLDSDVALLGMPADNDWILQATYNDKSFVRNTLMFDLFSRMDHYATRSHYCEVVLNGDYVGIYFLCEKIKRKSTRVDISKLRSIDTSGDQLTGGYIFKHDYPDPGWTSLYSPLACNTRFYQYSYVYPSSTDIVPVQGSYIEHFVDTFETRLLGTNPFDSLHGYRPMIDMNSFVDYFLINELSNNIDGYKKSMFFYKTKNSHDSTLHAGPVWDFDWSMKHVGWVPLDGSGWSYTANPCDGDVLFLPWWNIMMQDSVFRNLVKCRYEYFRMSILDTTYLNHFIDSVAGYLSHAEVRHYTRWPILGQNVGTPEIDPVAPTFAAELDTLKKILRLRIQFLDANLPGHCADPVTVSVPGQPGTHLLEVFPNPTTGWLHIRAGGISIESFSLYDLTGRLMITQPVSTGEKQTEVELQTTGFPAGLYLLELKTPGGFLRGRVAIQ